MLFPTPTAALSRSERDTSIVTTLYSVRARAEPGIMPRVLDLFAKRGLVPQRWSSTAFRWGLAIEIEMADLDCELAEYIGRTIGGIVGVETVLRRDISAE